ncbi:MAG: zinc-binding dehydrogenase [Verrucomicrobia bacterium]|nr:zinc-binding dehydrogenase [Verrucomicrobiota bacterium]
MKAAQLISFGRPGVFRVSELDDPSPAPEEVVVRVRACGLNRLDLWIEENALPINIALPRIPGSEIAGEITALGADVDEWFVGDRVTVQSNLFCGECRFCNNGEESLCLNGRLLGVDQDGGFAEQVVLPWRALVPLPKQLSFESAAALALAASTAMHMLTDRTIVEPSQWILVTAGTSGVGSAAVQIAKQLGANVITTASSDAKRELALKLGADYAVDSTTDNWPAEVRKITENRGVDLIIEHVGGKFLELAFNCLTRGGTVVTCGATAGRNINFKLWPFFVKQHHLIGSYGRNRSDLSTTLQWAAEGKIQPVIDRICDLNQLTEAFAALRERRILGKIIIKP